MSLRRIALSIAAALFAMAAMAPQAHAAFIIALMQSGGDVVGTGSGSINTAALTSGTSGSTNGRMNPGAGAAYLGSGGFTAWYVVLGPSTAVLGPSSFGIGGITADSFDSGSLVGVFGTLTDILLPTGYTSGAALSDTATWTSATFVSLGITPGTYTYTWGSGATADSLTVLVGSPEPGSLLLLGAGGMALAWMRRRRASE